MTTTQLTVRDDLVVTLEYDVYLGDGELVDTTEGAEPVMFIQGRGHIVPGLEDALYGLKIGDEIEVLLEAGDAYGEYDPEDVQWLPAESFSEEVKLEIGMEVEVVDDESDETMVAYIAEIENDEVLLDFNHPLAGEALRFRVKVVGLRQATVEELDHDHVHDLTNGHH